MINDSTKRELWKSGEGRCARCGRPLVYEETVILKFKEELCGPHGVLLLGKLLDPNGNELEATDSTIIKLAQEQSEASLSYQDEIPWGVCRLLQLFQGTNYQDI